MTANASVSQKYNMQKKTEFQDTQFEKEKNSLKKIVKDKKLGNFFCKKKVVHKKKALKNKKYEKIWTV